MLKHWLRRTAVVGVAAAAGLTLACGGKAPGSPTQTLVVTGIVPTTGSNAGGQPVVIFGRGFLAGATVTIGGNAIAIGRTGDTSISGTTVAHASGSVDVVVTNPDGTSSSLRDGYSYIRIVQDVNSGLTAFTDVDSGDSGVSTTEVYDARDHIMQFSTRGELIWTADGRRFPGFSSKFGSKYIDGFAASGNWFIVRFATKDGQRRAYLTAVDDEGLNPGTLVDIDVSVSTVVIVRTNVFPPGMYNPTGYTLSGVVTEMTPTGSAPVAGAFVMLTYGAGNEYQRAITDGDGRLQIRGLYDEVRAVNVYKDGYQFLSQPISVNGDTRVDLRLVRR